MYRYVSKLKKNNVTVIKVKTCSQHALRCVQCTAGYRNTVSTLHRKNSNTTLCKLVLVVCINIIYTGVTERYSYFTESVRIMPVNICTRRIIFIHVRLTLIRIRYTPGISLRVTLTVYCIY